jgi:two-component system sensor histidine kinase DesK
MQHMTAIDDGIQQRWTEGWPRGKAQWRRLVFPAVFLVVLSQTAAGVDRFSAGNAAIVGYAVLAAFCATYLLALITVWSQRDRLFWALFALAVGLWWLEMAFARSDASAMCIFVAVLAIGRLGARGAPIVVGATLIAVFVPAAIASWHQGVDAGAAVTIALISLAMYSFFALARANQALSHARTEVARLAAENERNRIARDLHDLLGHSLTTITVKAGLARRLSATDPERSVAEIAEVEELSRRSLADVRAAVTGYRGVTLAGELAAGRELLRAASIEADLPRATDVVEPAYQSLFGWVVREGLTNVVRHAQATVCTVSLGRHCLDIVDNGVAGAAAAADGPSGCTGGSGLSGLRERVEAAGGSIEAGARSPSGWRLHAEVPPLSASHDPAPTQDDTPAPTQDDAPPTQDDAPPTQGDTPTQDDTPPTQGDAPPTPNDAAR